MEEDISPCGEQFVCEVFAVEGEPLRCHHIRKMFPCMYYGRAICPQLTGQACNLEKMARLRPKAELNDAWH